MGFKIDFILTKAGREAFWNANNTGTNLNLTHIQLGSGKGLATGNETHLRHPEQSSPILNGNRINIDQIRLMATFEGDHTFECSEVGIWSGNPEDIDSVLFAYTSHQSESFFKMVKDLSFVFSYDLVLSPEALENIKIVADTDQSTIIYLLSQHETNPDAHPYYFNLFKNNKVMGNNTFEGVTVFNEIIRGNLEGNASTAKKLERPINLTIGREKKAFDGSKALNWELVEILPEAKKGEILTYDGSIWKTGVIEPPKSYELITINEIQSTTSVVPRLINSQLLKYAVNYHLPSMNQNEANDGISSTARSISASTLKTAVNSYLPSMHQNEANAGTSSTARSISASTLKTAVNSYLPLMKQDEVRAGTSIIARSISASILKDAVNYYLPLITAMEIEEGKDNSPKSVSALQINSGIKSILSEYTMTDGEAFEGISRTPKLISPNTLKKSVNHYLPLMTSDELKEGTSQQPRAINAALLKNEMANILPIAMVSFTASGDIIKSNGISSITHLGIGHYEVTLSRNALDSNYLVFLAGTTHWGPSAASIQLDSYFNQTLRTFRIGCLWGGDNTTGRYDPARVNVMIYA